MEDRLSGQLKPTFVLPFKITREDAVDRFRAWTRGNILTPRGFSSSSTLEKITGIYVPFWLYDYNTNVHLDAHCTRIRTSRSGDYEYTYTDHFDVSRDLNVEYDKIPADASEKMNDKISGYSSVNVINQRLHIRELKENYVLLPVWMLNYRYKGTNYQFAINGQTGKQVGTLPVSGGRAASLFGAVSAAAFVLLTIIGGLIG